jgi:hypothetical protein
VTLEEDALMVTVRKHALRPPDDCLDTLQATIPPLTRAALHRGLPRQGLNRLPEITGDTPQQKQCKSQPIGHVHIDSAEVRTAEGPLHFFVAIARTSPCAYAARPPEALKTSAAQCLRPLIDAIPSKVPAILTDRGIQFTERQRGNYAFRHIFAPGCQGHGLDHRLTTTTQPWPKGQVERVHRTRKEAAVKTFYYQPPPQLKEPRHAFLMAYNAAKRLTTLKGLTP